MVPGTITQFLIQRIHATLLLNLHCLILLGFGGAAEVQPTIVYSSQASLMRTIKLNDSLFKI